MKLNRALPLAALMGALALSAAVQAETVFKWVDANGVTNYTTTPPPNGTRKVAAVNASPAIASTYPAMPASEEAAYWRERRQREAVDDMRDARLRRDAEDLRQAQARQQMASQYDDDQRRKAEEARRQAMFDQCQRERRVDCGNYGYGYSTPPLVVARRPHPQPITAVAPFPVPGSPTVTNPTPGAPSLSGNPTPGAPSVGSGSFRPPERTLRSAPLARGGSGGATR